MLKFVVRRLILLIPILFGLSIFIFLFVHALPGDPASALLGERGSPEAVERLKEQLGLDRPVWQQYLILHRVLCEWRPGEQHPVAAADHRRDPALLPCHV